MTKISNLKKLIELALWLLFFFLFILVLTWFRGLGPDSFFYIHDQSPYISVRDGLSDLYTWNWRWLGTDGGMRILRLVRVLPFYLLYQIGLTVKQAEILYFSLLFVLPAVFMYVFLRTLFERDQFRVGADTYAIIASTVGAFLYSFNLFLVIVWHSGLYMNVGLVYAFLPLVARELIRASFDNQYQPVRSGILVGALFVFLGAINPPSFVALVPFSFLVFALTAVFFRKVVNFGNLLEFLAVLGLVIVLTNLWWLLPYGKSMLDSADLFINAGDKGVDYVSLTAEPEGVLRRLKLFMKWTFGAAWHGREFISSSEAYNNFWLLLPWFFVLFFCFTGFLHKRRGQSPNLLLLNIFAGVLFLISVLFSKGTKAPLGFVFTLFYRYFPFFNMFRSPGNKFGGPLVFSLAIMLGISTYLFLKGKVPRHLKIFIVLLILASALTYGWPFLSGIAIREVAEGEMPDNIVTVPDAYFDFSNLVDKGGEQFRVLMIPGAIYGSFIPNGDLSQGYAGPDLLEKMTKRPFISRAFHTRTLKPSAEIANQAIENYDFRLLPLMNSRFIAVRNEVRGFECGHFCKNALNTLPVGGRYEFDFIDVYEVGSDFFLPRFYVPQSEILVNGSVGGLGDALEIMNERVSESRPVFHLNTDGGWDIELSSLKKVSELFVEGQPNDILFFRTPVEWDEGWAWPAVSVSPTSWKYPLVKIKERWTEWRKKDPLSQADVLLWHGCKRISEISQWASESKLGMLIDSYTNKIQKVEEVLESVPEEQRDENFWGMVRKVLAYTGKAEEKTGEQDGIKGDYVDRVRRLHEEFDRWVRETAGIWCESEYCYELDVPEDGDYEVLLKDDTVDVDAVEVRFSNRDGDVILSSPGQEVGSGWVSFGKTHLEKGENIAELSLPKGANLLSKDGWREASLAEFNEEGLHLENTWFAEGSDALLREIAGWEPGKRYKLSFKYKTRGEMLGVVVLEKVFDYEALRAVEGLDVEAAKESDNFFKIRKVFETKLRTQLEGSNGYRELDGWKEFETEFTADEDGLAADLYIYTISGEGEPVDVNLTDVVVQKVPEPRLMLRGVSSAAPGVGGSPKITFSRTNPTKYRVRVEGSEGPYTLVFGDSFHSGWKIYKIQDSIRPGQIKGQNLGKTFWGVLGRGLSWVTDLFLDNEDRGEVVASYFDGLVGEGPHRDIFLEPKTFETWGRGEIGASHLMVNGFANAWYIEPEDVGGDTDYELIIEFWPQRIFYLGLFVSGLTLIGCLSYLSFVFFRGFKLRNA